MRYSTFLLLIFLFLPLQNTTAQTTFSDEIIIIGQVFNAVSVFSIDLDGDGDNDILSASEGDDKIAWYENTDGQGTFGTQQVISTSAIHAESVFSTDLDGDGDNDVLSASGFWGGNSIAWYENMDALGTFGPQQVITTNVDGARSVYSTDLDGDGDNDILSASEGDDKIAWYENLDGQGTFGPQQVITTSANYAQSVYSVDLDGDGDNDVLSASAGDDKIAWYENTDGLGTFGQQQIITTSANGARSVFSTDLDGDGDNDVLSASSDDDKIAWYENTDGLGTFGPQQIITNGANGARSVYSADVDGDGDNDVLSASYDDDKIAWYENWDGQGMFGLQQIITTNANGAQSVFCSDLDGDGDNDVLSASNFDNKIAWHENMDNQGTFGIQQLITSSAFGAFSVYSADMDGDGDYDVLSASELDDKIAWYENTDGLGTFGPQQVITNSANGARSVYSADLDGDGDNDVLSASYYDAKIAWYENMDGFGTFGYQRIITTIAYHANSVYSADLDGDGDNDVLSASYNDNKIAWYENIDGQGTFGPQQTLTINTLGARSVFSIDLDGDGDNDVLSASQDDNKIAWFKNLDGLGTFGPQQVITTSASWARSVFSTDLDGDGDNDVLSASSWDGEVAWYENIGGYHMFNSQQVISNSASGAQSVFSTDLDNDGDNDVLSASYNDDKIAWYENIDGQGMFGPQQFISTIARGARSVYSVDLDGDGDDDVLSASEVDSKIAWYRNETRLPSVTIELTYQSGSPIPSTGGNLIFDLFTENGDSIPADFDAWLETTYQSGYPVTLLSHSFSAIPPGWTFDRPDCCFPIPANWASGSYSFSGKVGIHPENTWNESSFPFVKEGTITLDDFQPAPVPGTPNPFEVVLEKTAAPSTHELLTIHPNPFNPTTTISFELRVASYVELSVYDVAGRDVGATISGRPGQAQRPAPTQLGHHTITFDGSELSSGIYFVRLKVGETMQMKKMVLIK